MRYLRVLSIIVFTLRESYTCSLSSSQSQVVSFCERLEGKGTSVVITSSGVPTNQAVTCSCNVSVVWTTSLLVTYESPGYPNCEMYIEFGERSDLFYLCKDSLNKIEVPQEFRIKYVKTTDKENPAPCLQFQTDSQASVIVMCYKYEAEFIPRSETSRETTSPSTSFVLHSTNFTSTSIAQTTLQQTDLSSTTILTSSTNEALTGTHLSSSSSSSTSSSTTTTTTSTTALSTISSSPSSLSTSPSLPPQSSSSSSLSSLVSATIIIIETTTTETTTETTTTSSLFSTHQASSSSSSSKSPSTLTKPTISRSSSSLSLLSTAFSSSSTSTSSPSSISSSLTTLTSERTGASTSLSLLTVSFSKSTQIPSSSKTTPVEPTPYNSFTGFSSKTTSDLTDESSLSPLSTTTFSLVNLGRSTEKGISTTVIVVSAVSGFLVLILLIFGVVVVTYKSRQAKAKRIFQPPNPYIDAFDSERHQSIDDNTFFNGVISTDHVNEPSKNLYSIPHNSRRPKNVKNHEGFESRFAAGVQVGRKNIGADDERNMSFKTSQQTNEPGLDYDRISNFGLCKTKSNDPMYDHFTGFIENPAASELVENQENSPYDRIDGLTKFATKTKRTYNNPSAIGEPIYAEHHSASDIHAIVRKPAQSVIVNTPKLVTFKGESENDETKYRLKGILKNKYEPCLYQTGSDMYPQMSEQHAVDNIGRIQMLNGDLYTTVAKTRKPSDGTTLTTSPMSQRGSREASQENTDAKVNEPSAEYDEMTFKRHLWHWD